MKIFIAGSMHFAKEMLETQNELEKIGFEVDIPSDTHQCIEDPSLHEKSESEHCFATDIMRSCMDLQEKCDAILVLNYPKHDIDGYIGANTLIEMGLAYYLKQKIYLLYPFVAKDRREYLEIEHMRPIVLDGDLEKIK